MQNKLLICLNCGKNKAELPFTSGHKKELVARIEFLEQKLFELAEENRDLRLLIKRL